MLCCVLTRDPESSTILRLQFPIRICVFLIFHNFYNAKHELSTVSENFSRTRSNGFALRLTSDAGCGIVWLKRGSLAGAGSSAKNDGFFWGCPGRPPGTGQ